MASRLYRALIPVAVKMGGTRRGQLHVAERDVGERTDLGVTDRQLSV